MQEKIFRGISSISCTPEKDGKMKCIISTPSISDPQETDYEEYKNIDGIEIWNIEDKEITIKESIPKLPAYDKKKEKIIIIK